MSDPGAEIDLTIARSSVWDVNTTANWQGWQTYSNGNNVTFDDSGSGGTVSIASSVAPGSLVFNNTAKSYAITGGTISGSPSLAVTGSGSVVLANANAYPGAITVSSGTLSALMGLNYSGTDRVAGGATLNLSAPGAVVAGNLVVANSGSLNVTGGSHTISEISATNGVGPIGTTTVGGSATVVTNGVLQGTVNLNSGGMVMLTTPSGVGNIIQSNVVNTLNMNGGTLDVQSSGILAANTGGTAALFNAIKGGNIISSTLVASNPSTYGVGNLANYGSSGYTLIKTALGRRLFARFGWPE